MTSTKPHSVTPCTKSSLMLMLSRHENGLETTEECTDAMTAELVVKCLEIRAKAAEVGVVWCRMVPCGVRVVGVWWACGGLVVDVGWTCSGRVCHRCCVVLRGAAWCRVVSYLLSSSRSSVQGGRSY